MAKIFGDRWKVVDQFGEGGQAIVYTVCDVKAGDEKLYVLKRLKNPERLARFRREIETALSLEHPYIIRIIDYNLGAEPAYFVSEYCSTGSLADADPYWKDDPVIALALFEDICAAIAYANAQGVVHRDLKPENILLREPNGPPVVSDFGICFVNQPDTRLTETEEAVGPRFFMAPELEDGRLENVSAKADSYSLGKILYWLVSGGRKFAREKHRDVRFDLKVRDEDTFTGCGWRNIFLEHVNDILDVAIVADPEKRHDAGTLMILARRAAGLIRDQRYPLAPGLRHPCNYCGKGYYLLRVGGSPIDVRNFGFSPVGASQWRVYACTYCGHVQSFRIDLARHKEPWGDGS